MKIKWLTVKYVLSKVGEKLGFTSQSMSSDVLFNEQQSGRVSFIVVSLQHNFQHFQRAEILMTSLTCSWQVNELDYTSELGE